MSKNATRTPVQVSITGNAPPYEVTLTPDGPYTIKYPGSTVVMTLDEASMRAGFKMFGIGFRDPEAESQLSAEVESGRSTGDTLTITDAKTRNGRFEFIMLYQDRSGGRMVYGFDPEILNEEP